MHVDTVDDCSMSMPCTDEHLHLMLASLLAAMMKSRESALVAEKGCVVRCNEGRGGLNKR